MPSLDEYKDEAERLWLANPVNVCEALIASVRGHAWTCANLDYCFKASPTWTVKGEFTCRTILPRGRKWAELAALLSSYGLRAKCNNTEIRCDYITTFGRRVARGRVYKFTVEFEPAQPLNVSVLTGI